MRRIAADFASENGFTRLVGMLGRIARAALGWMVLGLAATAASAAAAAPIEGTWRTLNGTEVTIAPCPDGYCGTLSWVVVPKANAAQCTQNKEAFAGLMLDYQNENKALRSRPILGMQMLLAKPTNDPRTYTATIYNAEDGKSYDGWLWVVNHDTTLRIGGGCIGQVCVVTQDWPHVPARETSPDFTCGE